MLNRTFAPFQVGRGQTAQEQLLGESRNTERLKCSFKGSLGCRLFAGSKFDLLSVKSGDLFGCEAGRAAARQALGAQARR